MDVSRSTYQQNNQFIVARIIGAILSTVIAVAPVSTVILMIIIAGEVNMADFIIIFFLGSLITGIIALGASVVTYIPLTFWLRRHEFQLFDRGLPIISFLYSPLLILPFAEFKSPDQITLGICLSAYISSIFGWKVYTHQYNKKIQV